MTRYTQTVALTTVLLMLAVSLGSGAAGAAIDAESSSVSTHQMVDSKNRLIDANLSDGGVYWQGQRIALGNLSAATTNNTNLSDVSSLHLRRYDTGNDELGTLVEEIEIKTGTQSLDTSNLEGTYVLLPADQRTDALQFTNGSVNGTATVSAAEPFEVLVQTLSVEWEQSPSGAVGSARQIEIRSNRLRYNVNVSSPELSYSELDTAFMNDRFLRDHNGPFGDRRPFERQYQMYDVYADSDTLVLRGFSNGALRPDFSSLERFPEMARIEVTDTGVTDRAILSSGGATGSPFNITRLAFSKEVNPGAPVTLQPTIKNDWQESASGTITFVVGEASTTSELTLDSGESEEITTTLPAPTEPGNAGYEVSTEGDSVSGTIIVLNTTSVAEEESKTSEDNGDGSGLREMINIGTGPMGGIMTVLSLFTVVLFRR